MLINSVIRSGDDGVQDAGPAQSSAAAGAAIPAGRQSGGNDGIFLGRQPITDRSQELVAFELLFRTGHVADAGVTNDFLATASVIANAFSEFGIQNILGAHRGFINIDSSLLMSDVIGLLPRDRTVLELLETVEATDDVIGRCRELRQLGYRLALDDVTEVDERIKALLPLVDMVKIDLLQVDWAALPRVVDLLRSWPVSLVAEKVDSRRQAERCMALGFDLFQGYYFARPETVAGRRPDPSKTALLKLLALIAADVELFELERELKNHPGLVYNLLRIVNSVACGLSRKIDSLRQCVMVLGRSQLQKWVQLLLYTSAQSGGRLVSPLMQMAATRGKWMETLASAQRANDRRYADCAFLVGILSLLDALLGVEMGEIVEDLNLADEVTAALLARQGALGNLLLLIEKKETNDVAAVSGMLRELPHLTPGGLIAAELAAAGWADTLRLAA
ncbi:MAG: EAL and HDOD domain-containing protein [Burkholderiales bacterium]